MQEKQTRIYKRPPQQIYKTVKSVETSNRLQYLIAT